MSPVSSKSSNPQISLNFFFSDRAINVGEMKVTTPLGIIATRTLMVFLFLYEENIHEVISMMKAFQSEILSYQ